MKKTNIFKFMMMAVMGITAMTIVSCDDDDDVASTLKLSAAKVVMAPKDTATVTVGNGTAPYTVLSSNSKIVTATVKDKTVKIVGVADGMAYVRVTDSKNQSGQVLVTVSTPLAFDKDTVEVATGKTATVTVKNGTAPYTVVVKDQKIATATVKDNKVTIKGVKAGKTLVGVIDKNKKTATISVTVK